MCEKLIRLLKTEIRCKLFWFTKSVPDISFNNLNNKFIKLICTIINTNSFSLIIVHINLIFWNQGKTEIRRLTSLRQFTLKFFFNARFPLRNFTIFHVFKSLWNFSMEPLIKKTLKRTISKWYLWISVGPSFYDSTVWFYFYYFLICLFPHIFLYLWFRACPLKHLYQSLKMNLIWQCIADMH